MPDVTFLYVPSPGVTSVLDFTVQTDPPLVDPTPVPADGAWDITISEPADGTYPFIANCIDADGPFPAEGTIIFPLVDADVATVRLLISDLGQPPTFTDTEIGAFLTLEGGIVKLAAASALDAIASNEALVLKRITSLDLQTDGPAVAKALRDHASALRAQAQKAADDLAADDDQAGAFAFTRGSVTAELTGWAW